MWATGGCEKIQIYEYAARRYRYGLTVSYLFPSSALAAHFGLARLFFINNMTQFALHCPKLAAPMSTFGFAASSRSLCPFEALSSPVQPRPRPILGQDQDQAQAASLAISFAIYSGRLRHESTTHTPTCQQIRMQEVHILWKYSKAAIRCRYRNSTINNKPFIPVSITNILRPDISLNC